ncbi:MAG: hypothetical protein EU532_01690 [Promethearchaeota archaeon]|nr:MAG: hypothetical protein EU532_01690 [Candidatus Lokiarchaeota archaeon]
MNNELIEMSLENVKYSETVDHLLIKNFFYDNIPLANEIKNIEQEIKIAKRIADVFIELKNGKKIVIEIQHSKITKPDLIQRTNEYNQEGIYVLWILDGKGPYDRKPRNESEIFISASEKELHKLYKGRVYYINAGEEGILAPVYALHFPAYFENKKSSFGFDYYKQSKTKYASVFSEIPSLQLNLYINKGFKLARFFDKNIKQHCISEMIRFLDAFVAFQTKKPAEAKRLCPDGLLLGLIIQKFHSKYGLYLIFDVLRTLKFLTVRDARFMFQKELWFQKCILP